ncbi:hypothetical protein [Aurantiacibacter gangjinensis]|uniref:Uncharacterized protein n=1 Tax=Aurantiacibacter gangjinensis TaxID=502682 RepID=A0A0G9MRK7_9SPHN|nr:hypothetical protein [Aurantiacibacter gangjinensis]APE26906.1 hypothetical protein BMF35_a0077 [Aurantiacibacter gangjinensis]KLE33367.1 hypothetical protein AAW01_05390 [Aurantiacibacter gangjinensis]
MSQWRTPYNDPLEIALQRELHRGEQVLWKGRAIPRTKWMDFGIYLFAVPWTAFALFWTAMAFAGVDGMTEEGGWLGYAFPLFGVPFILVGLGMLAAPFLPLYTARNTVFAVTDKRMIELRLGRRLTTKSADGKNATDLHRIESRDGSGTLMVRVGSHRGSDGDHQIDRFVIGDIESVMQAEDAVREMRERLQRIPALSS